MDSPNLDRALRFKSNAIRGGVLENVFMRNVEIGREQPARERAGDDDGHPVAGRGFAGKVHAQVFVGQFVTDWNAVLAALSLAILPVLVLYLAFSRQLIRGITSGAVK